MVEMTTDRSKWNMDMDGIWLSFLVKDREARTALDEMQQGREYTLTLKRKQNRRSLDANAYFWVLIGRLAAETGIAKTELYRRYVTEIGDNFVTVCAKDEAVDKLCSGWEGNGLGWVTETFPAKIPGCTRVHLYYGSSTYDTAQMGRLIDLLIQDCKSVGIETMTPMELSMLMEGWDEANKGGV